MATQSPPQAAENPLLEGLQLRRTPDPCAMVIFGASGDLAHKKLFPALYALALRRLLPDQFAVVGVVAGGAATTARAAFMPATRPSR